MELDTEARIRERAYALWLEEGCVDGRHEEHWRRAAQEIAEQDRARAASPRRPQSRPAAEMVEAATTAPATQSATPPQAIAAKRGAPPKTASATGPRQAGRSTRETAAVPRRLGRPGATGKTPP